MYSVPTRASSILHCHYFYIQYFQNPLTFKNNNCLAYYFLRVFNQYGYSINMVIQSIWLFNRYGYSIDMVIWRISIGEWIKHGLKMYIRDPLVDKSILHCHYFYIQYFQTHFIRYTIHHHVDVRRMRCLYFSRKITISLTMISHK